MNTLLLGVALVLNAPALKEAPKTAPAIVGEWIPESISLGGKFGNGPASNMRYEFTADGKWVIHRKEGGRTANPREYKLDAKADPKTIDVGVPKTGAAPAAIVRNSMLGIWKVDGDTLTICFSMGGDERPKSFEPGEDARSIVMILKRAKPSEPPAKK